MKLHTLTLLVFISMTLSCNRNRVQGSSAPRPNIILILCDDLGYADVGFNGAKDIRTPNIDQLAHQGMICSSAYVVHSFCGPSRAGIMTGVYPHTIHAQFNLPPNSKTLDVGIPTDELFLSEALKQAGYTTGIVGKWHLGTSQVYHPNHRGFDDFFGFLGGGHQYFPTPEIDEHEIGADGITEKQEYMMPIEHNGIAVDEVEYLTDAFSREAVRFISDASEKETPFFLYLAYNAPHAPMQAKAEDYALYKEIKDSKRRTYAAMVHAVDRGVSRVVETLKATGEYENTLIVFFSDNGGKLKYHASNYPLTGEKGDTYEGGYRTPMMFHWPEQIERNSVFPYTVSALDLFPTFVNLAGGSCPESKRFDGKSIWQNLKDKSDPRKGEPIFCLRHRDGYSDVGVRVDQWKALKYGDAPWQLFNLEDDIAEQSDVRALHPEVLSAMVKEAEAWSNTHVQPYWFHNKKTGLDWAEMAMPHFNETFNIDR